MRLDNLPAKLNVSFGACYPLSSMRSDLRPQVPRERAPHARLHHGQAQTRPREPSGTRQTVAVIMGHLLQKNYRKIMKSVATTRHDVNQSVSVFPTCG